MRSSETADTANDSASIRIANGSDHQLDERAREPRAAVSASDELVATLLSRRRLGRPR